MCPNYAHPWDNIIIIIIPTAKNIFKTGFSRLSGWRAAGKTSKFPNYSHSFRFDFKAKCRDHMLTVEKMCVRVRVWRRERARQRERERELCAHWWVWGGFGKLLVTVGSMAHIWQQFIFIGCLQMNLWWPVQTSIFTRDSLIADYLRVVRNISRATGLTWTCADLGFWYLDIQKKVFHRLFYSIVYYFLSLFYSIVLHFVIAYISWYSSV